MDSWSWTVRWCAGRVRKYSDRSLAGGFVFCLVRGHVRVGCFHYIWWLRVWVGVR